MSLNLRSPRGTKDILPDEQKYWQYLSKTVEEKCSSFGCGKIDTPIFEYADVFTKSLGSSSDVVSKEMFEVRRANTVINSMEKNDEDSTMVLRPEYTAGIVRSYIEHGMKTWSQPVKLYYQGSCFRYDRPQAGRYRQFNTFGVEIIGDNDPLTDAALIFLGYRIFHQLGLTEDLIVDINSVGCSVCRVKMKKKLTEYFEKFLPDLCPDCNRRYLENPLRILDCKEVKCQRIIASAPQLVDTLCDDCKTHFKAVLENLDNLQIPYNLNPRLVRGLDYYTNTVFEFYAKSDTTRQACLLGGGRYNGLVKLFGETDTPAVGFGAGMERIIDKMKQSEMSIPEPSYTDVCIVQIGEKARKKSLPLLTQLENAGIKTACVLGKDSLKSQLRTASKMRAKICLIVGQKEAINNTAIVRDMIDSAQETYKLDKLVDLIKTKLGK